MQDLHVKNHPMTCDEVVLKLYEFIDGHLSLEEVAIYKDHLEHCPPCKGFVQFEQKVVQIIQQKSRNTKIEIPATLAEKIKLAMKLDAPR